jgi:hypothetical protein
MGLYGAAFVVPEMALVVVSGLVFWHSRSRPGPVSDASVLVRLATDVRSGSSMRLALESLDSLGPGFGRLAERARGGRPMGELVDELGRVLGPLGPTIAAALSVAHEAGGSPAAMLEELAGQVLELEMTAAERRSAMAPAMLQATALGGVPVIVLVWSVASGRAARIVAAGGLASAALLVGSLLTLGGIALVAAMVRRSFR